MCLSKFFYLIIHCYLLSIVNHTLHFTFCQP
nr:MAG TPA: hypothetical protein [Caudoviricetes sp.]